MVSTVAIAFASDAQAAWTIAGTMVYGDPHGVTGLPLHVGEFRNNALKCLRIP